MKIRYLTFLSKTRGSAQVEMLAVYVAAGHASVAEGGLEVTDQASRAAEEDGERAQISLGGSHDTLQR